MKKMFIKVFSCDDGREVFGDEEPVEIIKAEEIVKNYLHEIGYDSVFCYHCCGTPFEEFAEVSYEGELSEGEIDNLKKLLKNITFTGGFDDMDESYEELKGSLKYINFIKIDRCVRL